MTTTESRFIRFWRIVNEQLEVEGFAPLFRFEAESIYIATIETAKTRTTRNVEN